MKYSLFFSFLALFVAYSNVQCPSSPSSRIKKVTTVSESSVEELEEPSLVLGIETGYGYCHIANVPILAMTEKKCFRTYLFACPAETDVEKKINKDRSVTKNTLFIKTSYNNAKRKGNTKEKKSDQDKFKSKLNVNDSSLENIEYLKHDCEEPVTPSVLHMSTDATYKYTTFLVGFEVFIGKEYSNLKMVDFSLYTELSSDFQWFNVLVIRFDKRNGNVLSVSTGNTIDVSAYLILASKHKFTKKTLDPKINKFGNDVFYNNIDIESLYSLDMQHRKFTEIFKDPSVIDVYFNVQEGRYLVENHLAPLDMFITPVIEQAAHSYGNIALMWKTIKEKSWSKIENHIKYLNLGIFSLYVITGTYGTLKLANKEIYLGADKTVRVPLTFWKMLIYKRDENHSYNMLIVTINNPYEDISVDLCPISKCEEYGWEFFEPDFYPLGRTYCCEVTEENIALLHLDRSVEPDRTLNLREVPHLDDEKLTLNLTKFIEDCKKSADYGFTFESDDKEYRNQPEYLFKDES